MNDEQIDWPADLVTYSERAAYLRGLQASRAPSADSDAFIAYKAKNWGAALTTQAPAEPSPDKSAGAGTGTPLWPFAPGPDDYVGWARYAIKHDMPTRLVLCDSDAEGAFKVFRGLAAPTPVEPGNPATPSVHPSPTLRQEAEPADARSGSKFLSGNVAHNPGGAMRTLTDHQVNPANDKLTITVTDEPGSGGANHSYLVTGFCTENNPSCAPANWDRNLILFQNGPINEVGVNGLTHEALLAILCDRMRGFQSGPYASADNAEALEHMQAAQTALQRRTLARMARGVEGTHAV